VSRVGLRCDAGPSIGVGHLSRCLALAEEFAARGHEPLLMGDLGRLDWARRQVTDLGLPLLPGPATPAAMAAAVAAHRLDLVVVDSYELDPACAGAVRRAGVPVLAVVDGDTRGQRADLYVDPNLGAERSPVAVPRGAMLLAGLRYALLRDRVRWWRPAGPRSANAPAEPPTVVCFFGGTDARDAAPLVTGVLLETGEPMRVITVAGGARGRLALAELATGPGQSLTVIDPTDDLPRLVVNADLVVAAAGTSMWELLCLGAAVAVVWVAENQRHGFAPVVAGGYAVGLGHLPDLAGVGRKPARLSLSDLLRNATTRSALSTRGWHAVDGHGRRRVVDAALTVMGVDQSKTSTSHLTREQAR
jgi:spore coat polysaccharide biosynthesis predicted glycosyltransferase SpsG